MKTTLSRNQKQTLKRARVYAYFDPYNSPEKAFLSGVRSEREQNAKAIERSNIGSADQRKALANFIRMGKEAPAKTKGH